MRRTTLLFAFSLLAAELLLAGCATLFEPLEQQLLFRSRPADPERFAAILERDASVEEVRLTTADAVQLHGLLKRASAAAPGARYPLVIVFGGVARETSWMIGWGDKPPEWGWLLVNYRGYGLSQGRPSERALLEDARLVYDWAAARADVDATHIVVLGRSLGSYVAVSLAAQRPVRGAILATPFDSLAAIGAKRYPLLPVGMLANGHYDSAALAPGIAAPALFVLAQNDEVTPVTHGEALARAWAGPKRVVTLPDTGHRMLEWRQEYWREVGTFLREMNAAPGVRSISRR
jgi:pimeloyl-ACP methyl ester carboxylesterase